MSENEFSIEMNYVVYAKPGEVFNALTNPDIMKEWIEGSFVFELKKGGNVELFDGWVKGEVLSFVNNELLSYSWKPNTWDKKTKASLVKIELKPDAAGTRVFIHHSLFPSNDDTDKHRHGWINFVLDPLNDYFIGLMK